MLSNGTGGSSSIFRDAYVTKCEEFGCTPMADVLSRADDAHDGILSLSNIVLNETHAAAVSSALQKDTTISIVKFRDCFLSDQGLSHLVAILKASPHITGLDLKSNGIGPEGCRRLAEVLRTNTTLLSLSLQWNETRTGALLEGLGANQGLLELDLRNNYLGAEAFAALARSLRANHSLQKLDLRYNKGRLAEGKMLAAAVRENESLTEVLCDFNDFDPADLQDIGRPPPPLHPQACVGKHTPVDTYTRRGVSYRASVLGVHISVIPPGPLTTHRCARPRLFFGGRFDGGGMTGGCAAVSVARNQVLITRREGDQSALARGWPLPPHLPLPCIPFPLHLLSCLSLHLPPVSNCSVRAQHARALESMQRQHDAHVHERDTELADLRARVAQLEEAARAADRSHEEACQKAAAQLGELGQVRTQLTEATQQLHQARAQGDRLAQARAAEAEEARQRVASLEGDLRAAQEREGRAKRGADEERTKLLEKVCLPAPPPATIRPDTRSGGPPDIRPRPCVTPVQCTASGEALRETQARLGQAQAALDAQTRGAEELQPPSLPPAPTSAAAPPPPPGQLQAERTEHERAMRDKQVELENAGVQAEQRLSALAAQHAEHKRVMEGRLAGLEEARARANEDAKQQGLLLAQVREADKQALEQLQMKLKEEEELRLEEMAERLAKIQDARQALQLNCDRQTARIGELEVQLQRATRAHQDEVAREQHRREDLQVNFEAARQALSQERASVASLQTECEAVRTQLAQARAEVVQNKQEAQAARAEQLGAKTALETLRRETAARTKLAEDQLAQAREELTRARAADNQRLRDLGTELTELITGAINQTRRKAGFEATR
ncbi:hypothetical protein PAPYR_1077 [Paratrimastix pyriformis]|uniref:Uncharacterized protein n=1 Tax=Paratrimastix pyriformis TaxID=342808 RepID=A0ABQ8UYH0_9EUKA|nr:hypothetical protein PAPYR_1077 [Paratrimastix pyriformis]